MVHHQFTEQTSYSSTSPATESKSTDHHHLEHLTHRHPLIRRQVIFGNDEDEFLCQGCNMFGSAGGVRYECSMMNCKFNLHEECATCPRYISTHIHPLHKLELNWEEPEDDDDHIGSIPSRHCNVCGELVLKGLYYTCPSCEDFFIHPVCTRFPERIRHVKDTKHDLTFESASVVGLCAICGHSCTSWRYRCSPCRLDIHLECVTRPVYNQHYNYPIGYAPPPPPPPYQQAGSGAAATSSSSSGSTGSKRRRVFAIVGQIATTLALGAIFGVCIISSFFNSQNYYQFF